MGPAHDHRLKGDIIQSALLYFLFDKKAFASEIKMKQRQFYEVRCDYAKMPDFNGDHWEWM